MESQSSSMRTLAAESAQLFAGVSCWMACSVGMLVVNKMAISAFPMACSLVALQFTFTVVFLSVCCRRYLHIGSVTDVLRWCRVAPFFTGMILTSILTLEYAPMTLLITFRALAPVFSLMAECFFPNPLRVSLGMLASLAAMILGVVIYVHGMDSSHITGIGWAIVHNCLAVTDRLLQRLMLAKDQDPVNISKSAATLLNNLLGIGPLLVAAFCTREYEAMHDVAERLDSRDVLWIAISCVVGLGISYTGIWAQSMVSATSFLVLVNANKFGIIFLEALVLRTKHLPPNQILGAVITVVAGMAYGKAREAIDREASERLCCQAQPITDGSLEVVLEDGTIEEDAKMGLGSAASGV